MRNHGTVQSDAAEEDSLDPHMGGPWVAPSRPGPGPRASSAQGVRDGNALSSQGPRAALDLQETLTLIGSGRRKP